MIRIQTIDGMWSATLECDCCGARPAPAIILYATAPVGVELRRQLREAGQAAGWLHVLVSVTGNAPRDLCPDCFTLPPEG